VPDTALSSLALPLPAHGAYRPNRAFRDARYSKGRKVITNATMMPRTMRSPASYVVEPLQQKTEDNQDGHDEQEEAHGQF